MSDLLQVCYSTLYTTTRFHTNQLFLKVIDYRLFTQNRFPFKVRNMQKKIVYAYYASIINKADLRNMNYNRFIFYLTKRKPLFIASQSRI